MLTVVDVPLIVKFPDIVKSPVTANVEPSNVRLDSAFAAFTVPSDVKILLSEGLDIVLNPVPEVPDVPLVPEVPVVPEVPLVADEPEEYAAHIVRLCTDDAMRESIVRHASLFVNRQFSWEHGAALVTRKIEKLLTTQD